MSHKLTPARRALLAAALTPAAAMLASPVSAGATSVRGAASHLINFATSTNWSGYASTAGRPFKSVSASWVQPTGTCGSKTTYSAFWVGLDGDGSNSVEQNGSSVDCHGGTPRYYAWFEMYPAAPVNYGNVVKAGDHFKGSVTDSGTTFTLTISDTTQGWTHTQHKSSSTAKKFSAEVITEAPSLCSSTGCVVAPLTNFGTAHFTAAMANGGSLGAVSPVKITMATNGGVVKAQPSALSSGQNFSVVWHHN